MATVKQKRLAELIVRNAKSKNPLNKKQMLVSVGYKKSVAETKPNEIMEQAGVTDALDDLGFNLNNAKRVVAEILLKSDNDPGVRLKASDQVFKVHGAYTDNDKPNNNVLIINVSETILKKNNLNDPNTSAE